MSRFAALILGVALMASRLVAQAPAAAADTSDAFFAVSYVEAMASSRTAAAAALKQYREFSRKDEGLVRIEVFEQVGRPAHFAVVERWRDLKSFEGRPAAAQKQLLDALQSIRVSGYDQRPYKTLSVGTVSTAPNASAVWVVSHVDVTPSPVVPEMLKRLQEASRHEAGNLRFDVMQHMMRANHFTVVEAWRDQKAFDAHVAAAHTRQYRDELQPLTGSPLDERVYKAVE